LGERWIIYTVRLLEMTGKSYRMKKWTLIISIVFNIIFLIGWGLSNLNTPSYKLGRLEKDITVGYFMGDSTLFTLPKGLTVKNSSERGISAIGQFENKRFQIVITSDDWELVNYDLPLDSLNPSGNFYSADFGKFNTENQEIPQGTFIYELYFAEFGGRMINSECKVTIDRNKITVEQTGNTNLSGGKEIFRGLILKHKTGKWILANNEDDVNAEEIGGCTEIPIIEFDKKIIEWC